MSDLLTSAVNRTETSVLTFAKFLSPNDTGLTGGHQCGIYIPKASVSLIFRNAFPKGENRERWADIVWNDDTKTHSRFVYYGQGTRDEYRITNFGRGFEWLRPEHTGDLIVVCKDSNELYHAYVFSTEEDIEAYLDALSVAPTQINRIVSRTDTETPDENRLFDTYLLEFGDEFPATSVMALSAEEVDLILTGDTIDVSPDETLVRWIDVEYRLFRCVEERYYGYVTMKPAKSLEQFVSTGLDYESKEVARRQIS